MACKEHKMDAFNIENAKIVILGTFPGVKSLNAGECGQYYANPTNKFWELLGIEETNYEKRKAALIDMEIGLWDVLNNPCGRKNSADRNIKNVTEDDYNDWQCLKGKIIFFNGKKARKFYNKATKKEWREPLNVQGDFLPSSSAANRKTSKKSREQAWNEVIKLSKKLKIGD